MFDTLSKKMKVAIYTADRKKNENKNHTQIGLAKFIHLYNK